MTHYACVEAAYSLYAGGWRAGDADELKEEYGLTSEETAVICEKLAELEKDEKLAELKED